MSDLIALLLLLLFCCCLRSVVSLSLLSSVSLLPTAPFKCTFALSCGAYNPLTTHQSEKPLRSSLSLVALSPTLYENTHNPHPDIPPAPCAHLAVRRAKRSVLIFLLVSAPLATLNGFSSRQSQTIGSLFTFKSRWRLCSSVLPGS